MTVAAALAGGFAGTVLLTTAMRMASALRLTRIDLPFLLGSMLTEDRALAKAAGYAVQAILGVAFALVYWGLFAAVGLDGWLFGAALGLVHGLFTATVLLNALLPALHPRLATGSTAADQPRLLGIPGFLMLNYGRSTPAVTIGAHVAYGAVVGGFVSLAPS